MLAYLRLLSTTQILNAAVRPDVTARSSQSDLQPALSDYKILIFIKSGGMFRFFHQSQEFQVQETPEIETKTKAAVFVDLTVELVSAYVSNNSIPPTDLGELIATAHQALSSLREPDRPAVERVEKPTAAQIRKSITQDAVISFEDGKPYKSMKRHLIVRGLTPETYRTKYGLASDYPMTSPSYSAQRSKLALAIGLGSIRRAASKAAKPGEAMSEAPKRRGGPPKAT